MLPAFKASAQIHPGAAHLVHHAKQKSPGVVDTHEIPWLEAGRLAHAEGSPESAFGIHEGQERHDASPLDGVGEITLLFGRETGEAAGEDLATLGDEFLEQINVLVINRITRLDRGKTFLEERAGHEIGGTEGEG
jgi:hypothetical protein